MSSRCVLCVLVALAVVLLGTMPTAGLGAVPPSGQAAGAVPAKVDLAQEPEGGGRISFIHAAPFAETITETAVTILMNGTAMPGELAYGDAAPYFGLPAGTYDIGLVPSGQVTPAITATITVTDGQDYTLAAAGDGVNQPLELIQVEDDWSAPAPGMAALRVAHLAPFAADLPDTRVDVRTSDGDLVDGLSDVMYGTFSDFMELPAGIYDLELTAPGGGDALLDLPPLILKDGDVVTVLAVGGANMWPLEPLAALGHPQDPARLRVAHLAPFAEGVDDTSVSVWLDGVEVLSGFTFSETTPYLDVPAGMCSVSIVPTGAVTPVITGTLMLAAGIDYTVAAAGNVVTQPLGLLITMDDNSPPPEGMARLRVAHAAPFAEEIEDTRVDVRTAENEVFAGLEGLAYGEDGGYLDVDPGTYNLLVTTPGGDVVLLDLPPVTLLDGDVATLYVVGDGEAQPLDALLVLGEPRAATQVQIAHLAPFASDPADTAVTVSVNGTEVAAGLTYSETTPFVELPAGTYQVAVTPEGTTDAVLTGSMFLTWGERYIAAAIGDGVNWPLDLLVLRDDAAPAEGMAALRIVHVAPFTSTLAATAVDVVPEDGQPFTEVTGLRYKGVTTFAEVLPGIYDLDVLAPDDGAVLLDIDAFRLFAGERATVFIVGDATNQPLGALIPVAEARTLVFMPLIARNAMLP